MRRLVLGQLAALALVLAGLAPWLAGVSGYDLAGAVSAAGGEVDGLPPAWLGYAWYALPVLGFIAWIGLYATRRPVRHLHVVVGALSVLFGLAFVIVGAASDAGLGWGVALALAAGIVLIVAGRLAKEPSATF